jgi:hypothetical protein
MPVTIPEVGSTVPKDVEVEDHVPPEIVLPKGVVAPTHTALVPEIGEGEPSTVIEEVVDGLLVQPAPGYVTVAL